VFLDQTFNRTNKVNTILLALSDDLYPLAKLICRTDRILPGRLGKEERRQKFSEIFMKNTS